MFADTLHAFATQFDAQIWRPLRFCRTFKFRTEVIFRCLRARHRQARAPDCVYGSETIKSMTFLVGRKKTFWRWYSTSAFRDEVEVARIRSEV